ncbi:MAG TPA: DNA repair protein RecN [bacterium]|nr:DNA repair protein RecN [bacterium]
MINRLYIKNYAIIDELEVEFHRGFNVITGETGAGKSIVIEALSLALGERANTDVIRAGADRATVECEVQVPDLRKQAITGALTAEELPAEYPLIMRREVRSSGRSRAFLNDTPCNVYTLKQIGDLLVDMHGQHEHQSLLNPDTHITFLDDYADHDTLLRKVQNQSENWREADGSYRDLQKKQEELSEKVDLYKFQMKEIRAVKPEPGEMEDLEQQRRIVSNSQRIAELVQTLQQMLYEGEASLYDEIVEAERHLRELAEIDDSVSPYVEEINSTALTVKEVGNFLNHYGSSIEHEPGLLDQIEERIIALRKLMKKFGPTLEDVLAYRDKIERTLDEFEGYDTELERLEKRRQQAAREFTEVCAQLHRSRANAAQQFAGMTQEIMHRLGMERAAFRVNVAYRDRSNSPIVIDDTPVEVDETGADEVEFYITTNPGEGEKPLAQIASGGEISRIMLAIKSVLAGRDGISTVIFDEIDIGISGRISRVVAEQLKTLAEYHQVVCITHLPQIASLGESHYVVGKDVRVNRTTTSIRQLDEEGRVREIATLVGGDSISEITLNNARELLKKTH